MSAGVRVRLGDASTRVDLIALARAYPGGLWVFDDDWLHVAVAVESPRRRWRYTCFLRAPDRVAFHGDVAALRAGRRDRASIEPADPWVRTAVRGAPDRATLDVHAREGGSEKAVAFTVDLDAAGLARLESELAAHAAAWPVRGGRR